MLPRLIIIALIFVLFAVSCKKNNSINNELKSSVEIDGLVPSFIIEGEAFGQKLSKPSGIVGDNRGNLFLLDAGNNRIIKYNNQFEPIRETGGFGGAEGLLNRPTCISIDNNFGIYVSDSENKRISIYDRDLNYLDLIVFSDDDDPLKFGYPEAVAANKFGELWITDPENQRLAIFSNNGEFDRFVGDDEYYSGLSFYPEAIEIDKRDYVYVGDSVNSRILVFGSFGEIKSELTNSFMINPSGIEFDRYNNIWVADPEMSSVFCLDQTGELIFMQDNLIAGEYSFDRITDLTILSDTLLAVCDYEKSRVLLFTILYSK